MLDNLPLEEACRSLLNKIKPLESETIPLMESAGRILATDFIAPYDLPPYRKAAMDGFALAFKENQGEEFSIRRNVEAGEFPDFTLQPGEAAGVLTGGHIPQGTEKVVPQEDVLVTGNSLTVNKMPAKDNICIQGEDIRSQTVLARKGAGVTPGLIAILAAYGLREIAVIRRPRVAILSLGNEIIPYDQEDATPGQVRDSNGALLAATVHMQGGLPTVNTTQADIEKKLQSLIRQADMVVTIGGTAHGGNDQGKKLLEESGAEPVFLSCQLKPGGHSGAGMLDGKPVIMLSGNPMACFVGYYLLAYPVLRALQTLNPALKRLPAVVTNNFPKGGGPRRFLLGYAILNPEGWRVAVLPAQRASMRRSLADCNCLIELPAGHPPLEPGARASIIPV